MIMEVIACLFKHLVPVYQYPNRNEFKILKYKRF